MTQFEQHVRAFWTQGGFPVIYMVPIGWVVIGMAMRSGFSRRRFGLIAPAVGVLVALAAGFVCEQLVYRSSRNIMAETGVQKLGADLQAAVAHAAFMPRLFGFAIAGFAAALIGLGLLVRAVTEVPRRPWEGVRWRRIVSTTLYFVAANLVVPTLPALGVAIAFRDAGATAGALSAAAVVLIGCALGWYATFLRDGGAAQVASPVSVSGA